MSYTSAVGAGGVNAAAKRNAQMMAYQSAPRFRGMTNDGKMSMSVDGGRSYAKGKGKKKKKGGGGSDALADTFNARFKLNEKIVGDYDKMIGGSAENLSALNNGYTNREALAAAQNAGLADSYSARTALAAQQASDINSGYLSREQLAAQELAATNQAYQDRLTRNMGYLDSSHLAEKNRVDQQFKERQASNAQDLVSRGLRGSSLAVTTSTGIEKAKAQAMLDIDESIRREKLSTDASLSDDAIRAARDSVAMRSDLNADTLRARRDALGVEADLSGEALRQRQSGVGMQADMSGDRLSFGQSANNVQNSLTQNKLNFMSQTRADLPGWEDYAKLQQNLGQTGYYGNGGYSSPGQGRNMPKSYIAGIATAPLSAYGYSGVPSVGQMMTPANLGGGGGGYSSSAAAMSNRQLRAGREQYAQDDRQFQQKFGALISNPLGALHDGSRTPPVSGYMSAGVGAVGQGVKAATGAVSQGVNWLTGSTANINNINSQLKKGVPFSQAAAPRPSMYSSLQSLAPYANRAAQNVMAAQKPKQWTVSNVKMLPGY